MRVGGHCLLIPNPRDFPSLVGALRGRALSCVPGSQYALQCARQRSHFATLDFSALSLSGGGGMAVQPPSPSAGWPDRLPDLRGLRAVRDLPFVTCNPADTDRFTGTIGLPVPRPSVEIVDDEGRDVALGKPGEIAMRGPQVMAGYWQRPDETAKVMTADGFFRTGDIGIMDEHGYLRIVDRKKDMILVSGFNVYPNEVEDVVAAMPGVLECAAVGVRRRASGEAVKLYVVRRDPALHEEDVQACATNSSRLQAAQAHRISRLNCRSRR